jgi:hypothetical protein
MVRKGIIGVLIFLVWGRLPLLGVNLVIQSGVLQNRIETMIDALPDKYENDGGIKIVYEPPTMAQRIDFAQTVFRFLYYKQYEVAATNALTLGYRLVQYTDTDFNHIYYILERREDLPPGDINLYHWGIYVFNPDPARGQLIIQAPHPLFDSDTGLEASFVFQWVEASFLFIAGTHRCNKATISGCSGSSGVCSPNSAPQSFKNLGNAYLESDVAHATNSMFDVLTRWLADELNSYYFFIQLHGFGQDINEPDAILSNGVDENKPPVGFDYLSLLDTQLKIEWANANGGDLLETEVGHIDPNNNFNTLLATTSVQGRYLNGGNSPCTSSAGTTNLGHFLHIEQGKPKIGNADHLRSAVNWSVVAIAIINTFIQAPLPVELLDFTGHFENNAAILEWKTLWEEGSSHFEIERSLSNFDSFKSLAIVSAKGFSKYEVLYEYKDYVDVDILDQNAYYRLKQVDFNGIFKYSESIRVPIIRKLNQSVISPNHGNGQAVKVSNYEIRNSDNFRLTLYNTAGKILYSDNVNGQSFEEILTIRLRSYPIGLYIIVMSSTSFHFREIYYKNL